MQKSGVEIRRKVSRVDPGLVTRSFRKVSKPAGLDQLPHPVCNQQYKGSEGMRHETVLLQVMDSYTGPPPV